MESNQLNTISVVVPVYREEQSIRPFLKRLEPVLDNIATSYEVIFVLDPSPDRTEQVILEEIERNSAVKVLIMSRRFGQTAASMAGILMCNGSTCIVIDVDLQDPPELILDMHEKLQDGYDVVYATRRSRKGETFIYRHLTSIGYSIINKLSEVSIPRDTGDFRILTRRVIEELRRLNENNAFFRGLIAYVGFRQASVEYDRDERFAGQGNYNRFFGSLRIGLNGLIAFSRLPLQIMALIGGLLAVFGFLLGAWYVLQKLLGFELPPGLSTTVLVVTFFSGIQLLALGLLGEYIGRIYDEVKGRPMYIIDRKVNFKS
jgi:dolichol-phosphate mannosyltransferase